MNDAHSDLAWLAKLRGRFIVFDGPDGSGKSTQFQRFAQLVAQAGLPLCQVREPGGTTVGEEIRKILLDPTHDDMDLRCEMLLYMACRAQLLAQRIRPALAQGQLVLADRFISSTLAYQGAGGGLNIQDILQVGKIVIGDTWPDLFVILDVDEKTAQQRLAASPRPRKSPTPGGIQRKKNGGGNSSPLGPTLFSDRIETRDAEFHRRVRQGFLDQAADDPKHYLLLDATADPDTTFDRLLTALRERLDNL
ncbi:MAG: dTMP kinase [Phycisphaeraceae bacterium]|nr:dTMP kinase [Phycisphaeraceae bacterium]